MLHGIFAGAGRARASPGGRGPGQAGELEDGYGSHQDSFRGPYPGLSVEFARLSGATRVVVVLRLRFVEEYRGRRIVTNGERFGVQGELVTDCRYLNVAGAKAAIDSEANIAARTKWLDWQRAQFADFIAHEGMNNGFACTCGWQGDYKELKKCPPPVFFSCPTCSSASVMMAVGETPSPESSLAVGTHPKKKRVSKAK